MKKSWWVGCLIWLAALVPIEAIAADKITLQLRWLHQFQFAGYYAAKEQGFYRDAGLDVDIVAGAPGREPVREVLAGRAHYGEANSELLYGRLRGEPLVALAAIFQHSPSVLLVRKDSGIRSPQDLVGRKVMVIGNETDADLLAMLREEGVDPAMVTLQNSSYDINDLMTGKTDAFNSYLTNEPYYMEQKGIAVRALNPLNYGVDFYTDVLFTTEDEIRNHPGRVTKFREASLKGWVYAMAHVDEMIEIIQTKYASTKTRDHLAFEAKAMEKLILPKLIEMGHMNPGRWQHMAKIFLREGMIEDSAALERLDGFLYNSRPQRQDEELQFLVKVLGSVLAGFFGLVVVVSYFNARLKGEVAVRTQALSVAVEKERLANRTKSELMANMSHELRTPLNAILGFSESMTLGVFGALNDKYKEYAQAIHSSGDHLLALINDILDVAAIEDHKAKLTEEVIEVGPALSAVVQLVDPTAEAEDVDLQCSVVENLPKLNGDERRLKQIVINLLSNAIKFTPQGGQVSIDAMVVDGCHTIIVADNGIGMDEADLETAMTKFGQVDSGLSRKYDGTGLGLPLTKGLVDLHGGTLAIDSRKGAGTTITVTFPAHRTVG